MLTPLDFRNSYHNIVGEIESGELPVNYDVAERDYERVLVNVKDTDTFTEFQWRKLVKICRVVKELSGRLSMNEWHGKNSCGTTHCLAGWAVALEVGDIDVDWVDESDRRMLVPDDYEEDDYLTTSQVAEYFLSKYTRPFFFFTNSTESSEKIAEDLIMKHFIDPILKEDDKDRLNIF
jgi:hypothetical protein